MTEIRLTETTALVEAASGSATESGRMLLQLISPGLGSSGAYTAQVLEAAAKARVFPKGTQQFLDHPTVTEANDRPERSVRDLAGVLTEDARWDGTALVAEAQVFAPYRELLTDMRDAIGLSIRATGTAEMGEFEGHPAQLVTSLDEGLSVDYVTKAGRGGKVLALLESVRAATNTTNEPVGAPPAAAPPVGLAPAPTTTEENLVAEEKIDEKARELTESRDTLQRERDAIAGKLALYEARDSALGVINKRLDEDTAPKLHSESRKRITHALLTDSPMRDGKLDEAALTVRTDEAARAEAEYVAAIATSAPPIVVSPWGTSLAHIHSESGSDVTPEVTQRAIDEAFGRKPTTTSKGA